MVEGGQDLLGHIIEKYDVVLKSTCSEEIRYFGVCAHIAGKYQLCVLVLSAQTNFVAPDQIDDILVWPNLRRIEQILGILKAEIAEVPMCLPVNIPMSLEKIDRKPPPRLPWIE